MNSAEPPQIFSKARRRAVFDRMRTRQDRDGAARFLLDETLDDFAERIAFMQLRPQRSLLVGFTKETPTLPGLVSAETPFDRDEESPLSQGGFDLILAMHTLATVNDLPGALVHLNRGLARGGVMIATFVGAGSLANLRRAMIAAEPDRPAARMHPLIDTRAATALLERAGFGRLVVDSSSLQVAYRSLDQLVDDLRDQGLTNQLANAAAPLARPAAARARAAFLEHADEQGRVVETFELVTATGWKV